MKCSDLKLTTPYLEHDSIYFQEVDPTPLKKPFDEHEEFEHFTKPTPEKYKNIKLSCLS